MAEKKVEEIMTPLDDLVCISAEAGLGEVVTALKKLNYPVVLVFDNDLFVGLVGIKDILNIIEPKFLQGNSYRGRKTWSIPVFWDDLFTEKCIEATVKKARDVMKKTGIELEAKDPLIKAIHGIFSNNTGCLPVVRDGKVVGVLRSEDLFREVCTLTVTDNAPVFTMDSELSGKSKVGYLKLTTSL